MWSDSNRKKNMSNLKILLLAAGEGRRFSDAGWDTPKCNLPIQKNDVRLTLLEANISTALELVEPSDVFVVAKPEIRVPVDIPSRNVIRVYQTQPGAAASAYLASAVISATSAVLVLDTDNFFVRSDSLKPAVAMLEGFRKGSVGSVGSAGTVAVQIPDSDLEFWNACETPGRTLLQSYSTPLYSNPLSNPQDRNAINIGGYFFTDWLLFQRSYGFMLSSSEVGVEIPMHRVVRRAHEGHAAELCRADVSYEDWKPCGTPMQYLRNRGF